ncbi:MAG: ribosome assembly factor SBDS [Candidatus Thermoplasmatota archaeon]
MVQLEKAVVARMKRGEHHFEVLVDPEAAEKLIAKWRDNQVVPAEELRAILATDYVFTHWSDGKKASDDHLLKSFQTTDLLAIAKTILVEGEIQLTAEQRKKMIDAKHKRVVESLVRNAWNPQAKAPHPRDRIERALAEAKFHIDPFKGVEEQVQSALKALRPLMPIAIEQVQVAVSVPAQHTGPSYGVLKALGEIKKEEWQKDGTLVVVLQIPAGIQADVYERMGKLTHGQAQVKLMGAVQ